MTERIIPKVGWFWTAIHWIVFVVTFGRNRRFLTEYATTIGPYIGLPPAWIPRVGEPWLRYLLVHERRHIAQARRFGLGSVWFGLVPLALLWLSFPLPLGLSWGRWYLEREAYAEGFRAELAGLAAELGREPTPFELRTMRKRLVDFGVRQMTSGSYGWAWPFPAAVRRWFEEHV